MDLKEFIKAVNEHISHYKQLSDGNAREIFEFIKSKMFSMKIKLCFEHLSCIDKINKIKKDLQNKDIVFKNIENESQVIPRVRFILSTNRHKADFGIPLVRQSNGVIFVIEENIIDELPVLVCRPLAIPPNDFNPKFSQSELAKHIEKGEYKIYEIQDGTTVTMFYDADHIESENITEGDKAYKLYQRGKWIYSTKNAFDVNSMIWRGFNYKQIIDDVLKEYPDFDFNKLDKNKSYTIGFKHPAFHPFGQPKEWTNSDFTPSSLKWLKSAWFMQSTELSTLTKNTEENIGLPHQVLLDQKGGIPAIFKKLGNSLKDFVNTLKINQHMNNAVTQIDISKTFLGLVLRTTEESKTQDLSDILLESALWQEIRKLIYQLPFIQNKTVREKQEQNFKNMTYIILDSFLDFKRRNVFIQVFPQYIPYYKRYDFLINQTVNRIYQDLSNPVTRNNNRFKGANMEAEKPVPVSSDIVEKLYNRFLEIVKGQYQTTSEMEKTHGTGTKKSIPLVKKPGMNKIDKKNIKTMIMNSKYVDIYFNIFHEN